MKGRDVCLWLFFMLAIVSAFMNRPWRCAALVAMLLAAASLLYYWRWYLPGAVRKSRDLGLQMVVLLPVNPFWAGILLRLDRERMDSFCEVYEVHIKSGKQSLGDHLQRLASDLEIAAATFPGALFMWQTAAPLPLSIRRMIRQGSLGTAFLKKGGWPVPRFPFTGVSLKSGHVKHGAIINRKELVVRTAEQVSS